MPSTYAHRRFGANVLDHLPAPLREKLEAGRENAYLSFDLATIRPEAPIDFAPKDAIVQPYNRLELYQLFQKLEFVRLVFAFERLPIRAAQIYTVI